MKHWLIPFCILLVCGCIPTTTPALPTIVMDTKAAVSHPSGGGATASGVVMPAQEAHLAFSIGGKVARVLVTLDAPVEAGQVMVALDNAAALREYEQAQRDLAELTSPLALASAKLSLAQAQKTFDDARTNYNNYVVDYQKGALLDAKNWLAKVSDYYYFLLARQDNSLGAQMQLRQAYGEYVHALQAVEAAEQEYDARHASGVAIAQSTSDIITGQYEVAKAALAEATMYLNALQGGTISADAHGEKLVQLQDARNRVTAAQEQLTASQIVAPFTGTVTALDTAVGENVLPGANLVTVYDVSKLHVETTDLSERDIPTVKEGQAVSVLVKPLNQKITGHVRTISPLAEILGGDVVYRVMVDLDSQPDGLRAGMSVEVNFSGN